MLNIVKIIPGISKRFGQKPLEVLITLAKSAKFVLEKLCTVPNLKDRNKLFRHSISKVEVDGLFLEFGVYKGESRARKEQKSQEF